MITIDQNLLLCCKKMRKIAFKGGRKIFKYVIDQNYYACWLPD